MANVDVRAERAVEERQKASDRCREVESGRRQSLFAGEGQQVAGQGRATLSRPDGLLNPRFESDRIGQSHVGELKIAHDGGQKIVEVMGDAAGEMTDGVHLLRLAQYAF